MILIRFLEAIPKAQECLPIDFWNYAKLENKFLPVCKTPQNFSVWYFLENLLARQKKHCPKRCNMLHYNGKVDSLIGMVPSEYYVEFEYFFSSNEVEVQKEYLVYDMNDLIGFVGGTLGLFVGFSFFELAKKLSIQVVKGLTYLTNKQ